MFCSKTLYEGDFIGLYSGDWVHESQSQHRKGEYSVRLSNGMVVTPPASKRSMRNNSDAPSRRRYPLAMANEPEENETANAVVQEVTIDSEHVNHHGEYEEDEMFYGAALVACTEIPADTEITWVYGGKFTSRNYKEGTACTTSLLNQLPQDALERKVPLNAVVSSSAGTPLNSKESVSSDPEWRGVGMASEIRRRSSRLLPSVESSSGSSLPHSMLSSGAKSARRSCSSRRSWAI